MSGGRCQHLGVTLAEMALGMCEEAEVGHQCSQTCALVKTWPFNLLFPPQEGLTCGTMNVST